MATVQTETDRNYEAFLAELPTLQSDHAGKFVLIHDRGFVDFFSTSLEATIAGAKRFGLGRFSVQEVNETPEHLGFYSYVGGAGDC